MRSYLVRMTIIDGDHEHTAHALVQYETQRQAEEWALKQIELSEKETDGDLPDDYEPSYFSFGGDGQTALKFDSVKEISNSLAMQLNKLGVAYFV